MVLHFAPKSFIILQLLLLDKLMMIIIILIKERFNIWYDTYAMLANLSLPNNLGQTFQHNDKPIRYSRSRRGGFCSSHSHSFGQKFAMCPWKESESHLRSVEVGQDEGCPAGRAHALPDPHVPWLSSGASLLFTLAPRTLSRCWHQVQAVSILEKCLYFKCVHVLV